MRRMSAAPYVDGPVTLDQLEAGVWARAEHVAIALGVDERTIRRRVRSGALERGGFAGRVYVRQVSRPASQAATDTAGQHTSALSTSTGQQLEALLAAAVREHVARVEHLATELGQARATVEQLERVRQAEAEAQAAKRTQLEHELAHVRQLARQIGVTAEEQLGQARAAVEHERQRQVATEAQLAQARADAEAERQRRGRLEELTRAPWYAFRVRRRLRLELA